MSPSTRSAGTYPQQRILTLWKDVAPTFRSHQRLGGRTQPEPLFFRGNSGDIIEYWHTNLVPNYYLVDDFQVRTPTDILGQHIHLVKFDVTSSDGAGNGFNYEDGTFSPEEVQEIISAINTDGGLLLDALSPDAAGDPSRLLQTSLCSANPKSVRCQPCPNNSGTVRRNVQSWLGAQTTIQRWYLDPLVDNSNVDRTLRTVFTHDHFGPSTHQQAGLYAGLLVEPGVRLGPERWHDAFGGRRIRRWSNELESANHPPEPETRSATGNSCSSFRICNSRTPGPQ